MMDSLSNNRKFILFIPTFKYLSNPLFISLGKILKDSFITKYFDPKDPFLYYRDINETNNYNYFDTYITLNNTNNKFLKSYLKYDLINKLYFIFKFIIKLYEYQNSIRDMMDKIKPDAIISTADMTFSSKIINKWALDKSIPFIIYQSTFIDLNIPSFKSRIKNKILYLFFNILLRIHIFNRQNLLGNEYQSNYVFTWGNTFKEIYKELPISKNVYAVGNPIFKNAINYKTTHNVLLKRKPTITICTEALKYTIGENLDYSVKSVYKNIIISNPNLNFIIKLHPRDSIEEYRAYFNNNYLNNVIIVSDLPLNEVYSNSDVQISVNSFSSFEAVYYNVPIVLFNKKLLNSTDYFCDEIELNAKNEEELNIQIKLALTTEYRESFRIKRDKYLNSRLINYNNEISTNLYQMLKKII